MRLRNVTNAEEIINNSKYLVKEPEKYKGNYNELFDKKNEIRLEIGMGKGNFIIENALKNPNINYIGIEKYASVLVRAVQKLEDLEINNLKLICIDANEINNIFDKEIDLLYLNFSDPWPKKRHTERRLTSQTLLKLYDNIFSKNKKIELKTDNRLFYEFSLVQFVQYGYKISDISLDLHKDDYKDNIPTEYEIKWHSRGNPIYKVDVYKN